VTRGVCVKDHLVQGVVFTCVLFLHESLEVTSVTGFKLVRKELIVRFW
jgi:hypothetical protein